MCVVYRLPVCIHDYCIATPSMVTCTKYTTCITYLHVCSLVRSARMEHVPILYSLTYLHVCSLVRSARVEHVPILYSLTYLHVCSLVRSARVEHVPILYSLTSQEDAGGSINHQRTTEAIQRSPYTMLPNCMEVNGIFH